MEKDFSDYRTFTIQETSQSLGVSTRTLDRWFFGYWSGGEQRPPLLRAEPAMDRTGRRIPVENGGHECLTWGEFIEAGHLVAWMGKDEVSMDRLQGYVDGFDMLGSRWETSYSLMEVVCIPDPRIEKYGNPHVIFTEREQRVFSYASKYRLSYFGLPEDYFPASDLDIAVNPQIESGSPVILGTAVTASGVARQYRGGDSISYVASSLSLTTEQVEHAIQFQERLEKGELISWL